MIKGARNLVLDIFDYSGNKLVNLYDNATDVIGQATDVMVKRDRNGWKELSFSLQDKIGEEPNYRLDYLKADYKIRLQDDKCVDWYIISEPQVTHNNLAKVTSVVAGHVAQMLKLKNLGLVFSDKEGNNIGTAKQLLTAILDGTDWYVGNVDYFYDNNLDDVKSSPYDQGKLVQYNEKVRSLVASEKTGAFKLITQMCSLFDARPVFHGESYIKLEEDTEDLHENYGNYCQKINGKYVQLTKDISYNNNIYRYKVKSVDIIPMNPFSVPATGGIPDIVNKDKVLELHYGTNLSNISRRLNTENIVTKLYAYGSFGDKTYGYCGIDECTHKEYTFTGIAISTGNYGHFTITDETGEHTFKFYVKGKALRATDKLVFSTLDYASMMYVYNSTRKQAYLCEEGTAGTDIGSPTETKDIKNRFSFLMDFTYYQKCGLFTDGMLQKVAKYQREAPAQYETISEASEQASSVMSELSKKIGVTQYCKLDVSSYGTEGDFVKIVLNKATHEDGVIYRTDYEERKANQFGWTCATRLKSNGDSVNTAASVLYIIHNTNPVTWEKTYLKSLTEEGSSQSIPPFSKDTVYSIGEKVLQYGDVYVCNKDTTGDTDWNSAHWDIQSEINPKSLTLWLPSGTTGLNSSTDSVYLFEMYNVNGQLGSFEAGLEASNTALRNAVKTSTKEHDVIFIQSSTLPSTANIDEYAWCWKFSQNRTFESTLYFCCKLFGLPSTNWGQVALAGNSMPSVITNGYCYNWKNGTVYYAKNGAWVKFDKDQRDMMRVGRMFGTVWGACLKHDMYYQGLYQEYIYTASSTLAAGDYAFQDPYKNYWLFTLKSNLASSHTLTYDTTEGVIIIDKENGTSSDLETRTVEVKRCSFDSLMYHPSNIFDDATFETGGLDPDTGGETISETSMRSNFLPVTELLQYNILTSSSTKFIFYDRKRVKLEGAQTITVNGSTTVTMPSGVGFIRATTEGSTVINCAYVNQDHAVINDDVTHTVIQYTSHAGELKSIPSFIAAFKQYSDDYYLTKLPVVQEAQAQLKKLDEDLSHSLGDIYRENYWQKKDYVDGDEDKLYKDALEMIHKISKPEASYSVTFLDTYNSNVDSGYYSNGDTDVSWPDLDESYAVHLVDPDIEANEWAFIDSIQKCYDQTWKTKIQINTNLTLMNQHGFNDVMQNIARVASEVGTKQTMYDKAVIGTGRNGQVAAERLEGFIDVNSAMLRSTVSNMYSDERGNLIFEAADGSSAMMLTGSGFGIANSKDKWGDWNWRTAGNGQGLAADSISTGYLSSDRIQAGTITVDKIENGLGAMIDLSNNYIIMSVRNELDSAVTTFTEDINGLNVKVSRKSTTYSQNNPPTGTEEVPLVAGDLWFDTNDSNKAYRYSGTAWVPTIDTTSYFTKSEWSVASDKIYAQVGAGFGQELTDEAIWTIAADKITAEVTDYADGRYSTIEATSQAITAAVGKKSRTYRRWTDPTTDASNEVIDGDIWIRCSTIGTTIGELANEAIDYRITNYRIYAFGSYKMYIRANDEWVLTDDASSVQASLTQLEISQGQIKTSVEKDIADVYLAKTETYQTADSILSAAVRQAATEAGQTFIQKTSVYQSAGDIVSAAESYVDGQLTSYSTLDQTSEAITLAVAKKNKTYRQYRDPADNAANNVINGDIWVQCSTIGTTIGELSAEEIGGRIRSYKIYAFGSSKVFVRSNNAWGSAVVDTSYLDESISELKVAADYIKSQVANSLQKTELFQDANSIYAMASDMAYHKVSGVAINMNGVEITGSSYVKIFAGSTFEVESGNFKIDASGNMMTKSGTIGGWNITENRLESGSGTGYVRFNSATSATYAVLIGGETNTTAPFWIRRNGMMKAISGTIGGWALGDNLLYSGTSASSNYVGISSNTSSDWVFWAGHETPTNSASKFRVKRDGTVYLTQLIALGEDEQETTVNLRTANLWKIGGSYKTIRSVQNGVVTLSDNSTFNTAASVTISGSWSGGTFTATGTNGQFITTEITSVWLDDGESQWDPVTKKITVPVKVDADRHDTGHPAFLLGVYAYSAYNAGWGNARQRCACARSGNRVVAARASSTPDGGAEPLFDQTASINDTHYVIKSNGIVLTPGTTFTGPAGRYFREEDISLGGSSTITWTDNS